MYANLASATKLHRATQIVNDIGTNGKLNIYTGPYPANPDLPTTGTLLVSMPLSSTAGVASLAVQAGVVTSGGTGGTDGVYNLVVTGGGGTEAAGTFTVQGGVLYSIAIIDNGFGYSSPPVLSGFATAGLTGATATAVMTGLVVFNAITTTTAIATGTAGFVRITTATNTPIIDLDIGTTNAFSVIINNTFIGSGGAVSCTAEILIEA